MPGVSLQLIPYLGQAGLSASDTVPPFHPTCNTCLENILPLTNLVFRFSALFDVSSAFDKVDHAILFLCLTPSCGIEKTFIFFGSTCLPFWLISVGDFRWNMVRFGVPQGSALRPIFYCSTSFIRPTSSCYLQKTQRPIRHSIVFTTMVQNIHLLSCRLLQLAPRGSPQMAYMCTSDEQVLYRRGQHSILTRERRNKAVVLPLEDRLFSSTTSLRPPALPSPILPPSPSFRFQCFTLIWLWPLSYFTDLIFICP